MNVLLSGHGEDREALDAARRRVAHRKLVLFTTRSEAAGLAALRESEALAGVAVEVHAVESSDLLGCLRAATAVLEREAKNDVRIHVAGGSNLVASALLLAAFERGIDAFFCHPRGISRLPVIFRAELAERFNETDRALLRELPTSGTAELESLAQATMPLTTVKAGLLRLRAVGAVTADHRNAALTSTGKYYREQLERAEVAR